MHSTPSAVDANPTTLLNVQAMRAVAALLVVVGHTLALSSINLPEYLGGGLIHTFAYAGVDIFFVISGLVICTAAQKHLAQSAQVSNLQLSLSFLVRRLFRIYPLYWAVFILIFCFTRGLNFDFVNNNFEVWFKNFWLVNKYNDVVPQAWSLAFEMYFYASMACILFFFRARYFACLLAWFLLPLALYATDFLPTGYVRDIILDPILLEFLFGCLVFYLVRREYLYLPLLVFFVGLFLFFVGAYQTLQQGLLASSPRTFSFGLGSAFIIYGLIGIEKLKGWCLPKFLVELGDVSYSIYLVHMGIIVAALAISRDLGNLHSKYQASFLVLIFLTVLVVSGLCHRFIERPFIALGSKFAKRLSP